MMMVPAYVSCSESSGFVTSLYALTPFNTNELTLTTYQVWYGLCSELVHGPGNNTTVTVLEAGINASNCNGF